VPQQPSVQTIVLQQPAKTHMELNASTDKTAISSFALSVVIALALGGLATWLAYWYGRKSFDLTKQSFDVVLEQIISSRQEAERLHKITMEQICANIESNKETSKNQLEIMFKDLHLKRTLNIFESLRNEFSTFFSLLDDEILKIFNFSDRFNQKFRGGLHIRNAIAQFEKYPEIYNQYMELKNKRFTLRNTMERINILLDQDDPNQVDISNRLVNIFEGYDKISNAVFDGQRPEQNFIEIFEQDTKTLKIAVNKLMSSEMQKLSSSAL
jgi:hypothetical protein